MAQIYVHFHTHTEEIVNFCMHRIVNFFGLTPSAKPEAENHFWKYVISPHK